MGIISHSVGRMGGYSSQKNLRLALSYFDMPSVGQPEVFLGQSPLSFLKMARLRTPIPGFRRRLHQSVGRPRHRGKCLNRLALPQVRLALPLH